jgi:hypothetical protein
MRLLRGLLDRLLLVAAVLCAGTVPSFIAQYRQRLGGRLDQVLIDLEPFRRIAAQYHGGSLEALVRHHLASSDATFRAEGAAVRAMMDSAAALRAAVAALNADLWHQLLYLAGHLDVSIARETWRIFAPAVPLQPEPLVFAAICGLLVWLLAAGLWRLCAALAYGMRARRARARRP